MAEDLQGQLRPSESLTSRHRYCWQLNHKINGGQDTGKRGVPGNDCCGDAKPATDLDHVLNVSVPAPAIHPMVNARKVKNSNPKTAIRAPLILNVAINIKPVKIVHPRRKV